MASCMSANISLIQCGKSVGVELNLIGIFKLQYRCMTEYVYRYYVFFVEERETPDMEKTEKSLSVKIKFPSK